MSQKGNKTWVGRSQERCGKKINEACTGKQDKELIMLKESTVRDMECTTEKSNKRALNEAKKKKEESIDIKDEHIHNQYLWRMEIKFKNLN